MSAAADVPRVLTPAQRNQRRSELYSLMGDLPAWNRPVGVEVRSREETPHYSLERLVLDLNGEEPVPAVFTKPKGAAGRLPTVLFNHSHGGGYNIGKKEYLEGRSYLSTPPYAEELARLGYAGLCFDTWAFGERATRKESEIFKDMLWKGQVMWGMMVFDSLRAIGISLPSDVDTAPWNLGISMGSHGLVGGCSDRRQSLRGHLLPLDFDALTGWVRSPWRVLLCSALRKHFTTAQINALIAPRATSGS